MLLSVQAGKTEKVAYICKTLMYCFRSDVSMLLELLDIHTSYKLHVIFIDMHCFSIWYIKMNEKNAIKQKHFLLMIGLVILILKTGCEKIKTIKPMLDILYDIKHLHYQPLVDLL